MGGGNRYLDSNKPLTKSLSQGNGLSFDSPSLALGWRRGWVQSPKFYFILGIIFNLSLLGFFKYTDFLLENFNAFSQIAHLDFNIPLPHILLPLALSFVTFQQIAFLFDCYKHATGQSNENLHIDFIDYALFISFFPQLIAGPIVHHREMMPQFAKMGANSKIADSKDSNNPSLRDSQRESKQSAGFVSEAKQPSKHSPSLALGWCSGWVDSTQKSTINYEFLAKGIFIFSIGLFKKVFIADSFAKWANAGFDIVEKGGYLNIAESWATSLSYTFQLYFDFSGYYDMAIGLGLMFGIVLPLNFNSPYKSLNIAEFWRRWHITLGRFLKECLYIPLGGNRVSKILNLRNLFIVAFLSGVWHGAGWGFVIWGVLHGIAMVIHRIYSWFVESRFTNLTQSKIYKILAWFITFNFINIAWIFFRAENLSGAVNLLKGMFGIVWVDLPQKWHRMPETLAQINGRNDTIFYIIIAIFVCLVYRNSFEKLQNFAPTWLNTLFIATMTTIVLFSLLASEYTPFLYFNF